MEKELHSIVEGIDVPGDLKVIYDDMHGLWGGITITVRGDGSLERQVKELGSPGVETMQKIIDRHDLIELVRLLIELKAWEQHTADSQPVPGESRASLTISVKESAGRVWERFNEMPANNRLIQIKTRMENL